MLDVIYMIFQIIYGIYMHAVEYLNYYGIYAFCFCDKMKYMYFFF